LNSYKTFLIIIIIKINLQAQVFLHNVEVRYSVKSLDKTIPNLSVRKINAFGSETHGSTTSFRVDYSLKEYETRNVIVPRVANPLISGLRQPQIATSGYLKICCILNTCRPKTRFMLAGGDGSGGMSAALMRKYPSAYLIFNSLLDMTGVSLKGTMPTPPSALMQMPLIVSDRCINLKTVWEAPNDLSSISTWYHFKGLMKSHGDKLDLLVFDMEIKTEAMTNRIENLME
jgi:mRNA capping enzyme